MFGTFRTFLALAVVFEHLGPVPYVGPYAVFGFYALSGYLMTLIMHQTYGYSPKGLGRYAANRGLRIYPIYILAAALTLILVATLGEPFTRAFHTQIGWPSSTEEAIRNLTLVLSINTDTRLVPPAWALTVECTYYLLIGLGLSRSLPLTLLWFAASLSYTCYLVFGGAPFSYRYYTIPAASLPFSIGAMIYHLGARGLLERASFRGNRTLCILIAAILGNYALCVAGSRHNAVVLHFYANLALLALMVAHLSRRRSASLRALDKALGDLSYPIYLIHFQAGLIVAAMVPAHSRGEGTFLMFSLPLVLLLAWLLTRLVEKPIERIRGALRAGSARGRGLKRSDAGPVEAETSAPARGRAQ